MRARALWAPEPQELRNTMGRPSKGGVPARLAGWMRLSRGSAQVDGVAGAAQAVAEQVDPLAGWRCADLFDQLICRVCLP